jgi:hypothetical protein
MEMGLHMVNQLLTVEDRRTEFTNELVKKERENNDDK